MTNTDLDALTGRDLDRAIALALGWSSLRCIDNVGDWYGVEPDGLYPLLPVPAYSSLDGPLSPMLAYLAAAGWDLRIEATRRPNMLVSCVVVHYDPYGRLEATGATINEAVARCVVAVGLGTGERR